MPNYLDVAKHYFGERVFMRFLDWIEKDPDEHLPTAIDLILKAPLKAEHRNQLVALKDELHTNPTIRQLIERVVTLTDANVKRRLLINVLLRGYLAGQKHQQDLSKEWGVNVPAAILIDPTSRCNLTCEGCWAGAYGTRDELSFEEVDRIITEAKELGIFFMAFSGGEPTLWPSLIELCRKHQDIGFMMYTNGTLIDAEMAEAFREVGNISPTISIEGDREWTDARRGEGVYDQIMAAMDQLREHGVAFGASVTLTRQNCFEVFGDKFVDHLINKGVLYIWSFHYMPIGRNPDYNRRITPEQRADLVHRVGRLRTEKPILIADFWNDGHLTYGCIAGGRGFFHIAADGAVEPCAFAHFSNMNIKGSSLKQVLQSPLFRAYKQRQPFDCNYMKPCPIVDNPSALREMVDESHARPTHEGADDILNPQAAEKLESYAQEWDERAKELEQERETIGT